MFALRGLTYKDILDIPSLDISEGRVTCILGESGSGKTTLLKMLNRMLCSDSGTISYKGRFLETLDPVVLRREVVMLTQNPVLFPGNIRENLQAGLRFSQRADAHEESLQAVLDMVRLRQGPDERSDILSGGERQRLALARIILMDPEVYLLDEPSSALDDDTEKTVIQFITHHIRKKCKTLVMVTHSRRIAEVYADETFELEAKT